ncbi:unnamed protein product [Closterium sp. Naga37s-1]|nr:unnamed protein product [Closterium sp. Naga37s-1]
MRGASPLAARTAPTLPAHHRPAPPNHACVLRQDSTLRAEARKAKRVEIAGRGPAMSRSRAAAVALAKWAVAARASVKGGLANLVTKTPPSRTKRGMTALGAAIACPCTKPDLAPSSTLLSLPPPPSSPPTLSFLSPFSPAPFTPFTPLFTLLSPFCPPPVPLLSTSLPSLSSPFASLSFPFLLPSFRPPLPNALLFPSFASYHSPFLSTSPLFSLRSPFFPPPLLAPSFIFYFLHFPSFPIPVTLLSTSRPPIFFSFPPPRPLLSFSCSPPVPLRPTTFPSVPHLPPNPLLFACLSPAFTSHYFFSSIPSPLPVPFPRPLPSFPFPPRFTLLPPHIPCPLQSFSYSTALLLRSRSLSSFPLPPFPTPFPILYPLLSHSFPHPFPILSPSFRPPFPPLSPCCAPSVALLHPCCPPPAARLLPGACLGQAEGAAGAREQRHAGEAMGGHARRRGLNGALHSPCLHTRCSSAPPPRLLPSPPPLLLLATPLPALRHPLAHLTLHLNGLPDPLGAGSCCCSRGDSSSRSTASPLTMRCITHHATTINTTWETPTLNLSQPLQQRIHTTAPHHTTFPSPPNFQPPPTNHPPTLPQTPCCEAARKKGPCHRRSPIHATPIRPPHRSAFAALPVASSQGRHGRFGVAVSAALALGVLRGGLTAASPCTRRTAVGAAAHRGLGISVGPSTRRIAAPVLLGFGMRDGGSDIADCVAAAALLRPADGRDNATTNATDADSVAVDSVAVDSAAADSAAADSAAADSAAADSAAADCGAADSAAVDCGAADSAAADCGSAHSGAAESSAAVSGASEAAQSHAAGSDAPVSEDAHSDAPDSHAAHSHAPVSDAVASCLHPAAASVR